MNNLLGYLVQSGINLVLFYSIFWLFMRNDTSFKASRLYLMFSAFFSMIIPLINIEVPDQASTTNYVYLLEAIVITPDEVAESIYSNQNLNQLWWIVYFTGTGFLTLRFLHQLFRVWWIVYKFGITHRNGLTIIRTDRKYPAFSFFNIIFIGANITDHKELDKIIAHEKVHIQQHHSFDLILLELIIILQWFNPVIWLYKVTIRSLHEYLADQGVLSNGYSKADYQQMLVNQTFGVQYNFLINNFNHSLIKRRFIMMSKMQTNRNNILKMFLILPVSIIISMIFSITLPAKLIAQEPEKAMPVKKENATKEKSVQNGDVFTVVEKMPSYPGGEEARIKFFAENIKYPQEARNKGITGTVYVTYVVEKDGSITNVKIIRGIGGGCDEESVRVVSSMPKWNPGMEKGKPVRTQFNIPIKYSLEKSVKKNKNNGEIENKTPQSQTEKK
jgi:TonB family protein